jgi:hypothetical protein
VDGVLRREPAIEMVRAREVGLQDRPDDQVLQYAAEEGLLVASHDVNTMVAAAQRRIRAGQAMPGLLMVRQRDPVGPAIDGLVLIWSASELEEWEGEVWFLPL